MKGAEPAGLDGLFDARRFGAVGDGKTKDTQAIQSAIDACTEAGGGTARVPAGTYLTGTLWLRDHVNLHLDPGATLLGSPDRQDYNPEDAFPENEAFTQEQVTACHLVIAYRIENASITGGGTIDGNSVAFFGPPSEGPEGTYRYKNVWSVRDWRPGQMVFFCSCRHVRVQDVSLVDSPYWTLFFLGCEDVHVRGLSITNPPATRNGDGIDIDSCRNVTVSDCTVFTGDDSLTIRGNPRALENPMPCENVTVTNCVLASPCCAIRVGVGEGWIRNCSISNIVVPEARTGICMVCRYSDRMPRGTRIESIAFSDFTMDCVLPVQVIVGAGAAHPGGIYDVSFSRFRVRAEAGMYLGGDPDLPISGLQLRDWDLRLDGGTDNTDFVESVPYPYPVHGCPGFDGGPALPCAVYGAHLQDVLVRDLTLKWGDRLGEVWRDGLRLDQVEGLRIDGASLRQPGSGGGTAIHCRQTTGITVTGCQARAGTTTFLRVEEGGSDTCAVMGNHFIEAERPFASDGPVREAGNLL